jgi:hypothetical protein
MRAPEPPWATFLLSVAKDKTHEIQDWRKPQRCLHVFVTKEVGVAHDFFCDRLEPHDPFPLDRQWICATNKLANQISQHLQQWKTRETQSFGIVFAFTELIRPLFNCPVLSEAQQIDFIEKIDTSDLPPNDIHILEGRPFILIRNFDTWSGLVNGRRCHVIQIKTEQ